MELQEALEIVSYKLALKKGTDAHSDPVLLSEIIDRALSDKTAQTERKIDARSYMNATKLVNENRKEHARKVGEEWLGENAKNDGIVATSSGLQYRIIKQGTGPTCKLDDEVEVSYEGSLIDGSIFDSTLEKGTTAQFAVSGVIKGWQEGLQLMSEGSAYELFIPQELGYGDRGSGSAVPPFATLIFRVKVIRIK